MSNSPSSSQSSTYSSSDSSTDSSSDSVSLVVVHHPRRHYQEKQYQERSRYSARQIQKNKDRRQIVDEVDLLILDTFEFDCLNPYSRSVFDS
jgi:hypothetical protein